MYSGTDVEGSETEMGEELNKEISDPQSAHARYRLQPTWLRNIGN